MSASLLDDDVADRSRCGGQSACDGPADEPCILQSCPVSAHHDGLVHHSLLMARDAAPTNHLRCLMPATFCCVRFIWLSYGFLYVNSDSPAPNAPLLPSRPCPPLFTAEILRSNDFPSGVFGIWSIRVRRPAIEHGRWLALRYRRARARVHPGATPQLGSPAVGCKVARTASLCDPAREVTCIDGSAAPAR